MDDKTNATYPNTLVSVFDLKSPRKSHTNMPDFDTRSAKSWNGIIAKEFYIDALARGERPQTPRVLRSAGTTDSFDTNRTNMSPYLRALLTPRTEARISKKKRSIDGSSEHILLTPKTLRDSPYNPRTKDATGVSNVTIVTTPTPLSVVDGGGINTGGVGVKRSIISIEEFQKLTVNYVFVDMKDIGELPRGCHLRWKSTNGTYNRGAYFLSMRENKSGHKYLRFCTVSPDAIASITAKNKKFRPLYYAVPLDKFAEIYKKMDINSYVEVDTLRVRIETLEIMLKKLDDAVVRLTSIVTSLVK